MQLATSTAILTAALAFAVGCGSDVSADPDPGPGGGVSFGGGGGGGAATVLTGGSNGTGTSGGGAGAHDGGGGAFGAAAAGTGTSGTGAVGGSSGGSVAGGSSAGSSAAGGGGASGGGAGGASASGGGASGVGGSAAGSGAGSGGGSGVVFPPNCKCLGMGPPACVPTGNVTFTLARSASPNADEQKAYDEITCAMTAAVAYYNCNTTISKKLNVSYVPSVATADGSYNGSVRFGSDKSYMECATGMHEIAHTLGVGTAPNWPKVSTGGLFNGQNAIAQLRAITGIADDAVHSDTQHFWPYGLNYASEAKSTADLVDHCLIVTAMLKDLGL